ncbi:PadR family transcriptional regulator [Umezawaea beigongshangensis]|uniref:PadR family transcriptional regulator n=1 Tax=Umezawaea beigongshangensis TaxID=2780383 RepID=UPI0018F1B0EE|nr:PadR family transcriptional regulator [Umezawaea beigongshangensis]
MSAIRVLVLGVVRWSGEAHGYQLRQRFRAMAVDRWANVQPGSVYHALKTLTAEGLLESVGTEDSSEGPARTRYRATPAGRTALAEMVCRAFGDTAADPTELGAAAVVMVQVPRERVLTALRHRLAALEAEVPAMRQNVGTFAERGLPEHVDELANLWAVHGEAQLSWTRTLVEHVESGRYSFADEAQ